MVRYNRPARPPFQIYKAHASCCLFKYFRIRAANAGLRHHARVLPQPHPGYCPSTALASCGRLGRKVTSGWQFLNITTLASGLPFSVYSGMQQTGMGVNGADRPDQVGRPVFSTSRKIREDYFGLGAANPSFFSIPIHLPGGTGPNQGRFGTLGRDTFRGPGFHNFDVALTKDTEFARRGGGEPVTLQFRAEFFNVFNLVNFGLPSNVLVGSGFGIISQTAGSSRQIQLSLKLFY